MSRTQYRHEGSVGSFKRGTAKLGRCTLISGRHEGSVGSLKRGTGIRDLVRAFGLAVVVAVLATACGGQSDTTDTTASVNTATTAVDSDASDVSETQDSAESAASDSANSASAELKPAEISDDVPDVEMINVSTGEMVNLRSVINGDLPVLLWFWAPH